MLFKPFRALRPLNQYAEKVIAPPYDVVSSAEARKIVADNRLSFLHIAKPEIDLPDGVDQYSSDVYEKGAENLKRLIADGVLIREEKNCFYVYRITMGKHSQVGVGGLVSASAYRNDTIKKHEFTLPVKEDDRFNQIRSLQAQTGPVLLTYPFSESIKRILDKVVESVPLYNVEGPNKTRHEIWAVSDENTIHSLSDGFDALPAMYIADGHHRMAAGSRVADVMKSEDPDNADKYDGVLAVAFADNEMQVLPYNRAIRDLNGYTPSGLIGALMEGGFSVNMVDCPFGPRRCSEYGMYLEGRWYRLTYGGITSRDPVAKLDVSILSSNVFNKLFGITDLRNDKRIAFIGGIRGLGELERMVDSGEFKVAFSLYATPVSDMMNVAVSGTVMPPKSTWFEPKLADGLLSNSFE